MYEVESISSKQPAEHLIGEIVAPWLNWPIEFCDAVKPNAAPGEFPGQFPRLFADYMNLKVGGVQLLKDLEHGALYAAEQRKHLNMADAENGIRVHNILDVTPQVSVKFCSTENQRSSFKKRSARLLWKDYCLYDW